MVATELGLALAKRGHNIHFITYNIPVRLEALNDPKIYFPLLVLAVFNILFGIYAYPVVNSAFNASAAIFWKAL